MARWKIAIPMYLNCIGDAATVWEYKEVDRSTGRERRKTLPVPRLLNPEDPADWTWVDPASNRDNKNGEIIVCHEGKGKDRDIAFIGDPTPDMIPVDDEAKAISNGFADHWRYKPESAEISYSQSMLDKFMAEKAEAQPKPQQVEIAGLADLVAAITAQNQQVLAMLAASSERRKL
jgi:hypothetical protein